MAHTHSHPSSPGNDNAKRLMLAFGVTATFMVIEVIGGLVSGSLALLADAGHMLTDAAALLFALLAVQFARRPPNARHTFGWLRLTTLAAFVTPSRWWLLLFLSSGRPYSVSGTRSPSPGRQ